GFWLLYRFYRGRRRAGLPVGPPVPVGDDVPVPPDDLHASAIIHPPAPGPAPVAVPEAPLVSPAPPPADAEPKETVGTKSVPSAENIQNLTILIYYIYVLL